MNNSFPNLMYKLLLFILHVHHHYELRLTTYLTLMSESTVKCFIWVRTQTGILEDGYMNSSMFELGLIYLVITTGTNPKNGKNDR